MVNRIVPATPPQGMKTYSIARPTATHTRPARCAEVGCDTQASGWQTKVDEATVLGRRQANYIRHQAGRAFTERRDAAVTVFTFPPGQECFTDHRVDLDRPELYLVRPGDWRAYGTPRQHSGPDAWLNDCGEHLNNLNRTINGKA